MDLAQHYIRARHTSSLKVDPRTIRSATDILAAVGMAAQDKEHEAALLLWQVCYGGKTGQKLALVETLAREVWAEMLPHGWKGKPRTIAKRVLAYYLHTVCPACDGTGYQFSPEKKIRTDILCPVCGGFGKPILPPDPAFDWLLRQVESMVSTAAGRIMQKLAREIDFKKTT